MLLDDFITANRNEIITRCTRKMAGRSFSNSDAGGHHDVSLFLNQLIDALGPGARSSPDIAASAMRHGRERLTEGASMSEVVHDYGDICQAITEVAGERNASLTTADFGIMNRCLDDAIAGAVSEYGRARDQWTSDVAAARGAERMGFFAHELRNLVNTAIVSLEVLRTGNVGVGGSTGDVLHRSLLGLRTLVARSLAGVRLSEGVQRDEPILLSTFIEELGAAAALDANARGIQFTIQPVEATAAIAGDRQVLAAVVGNLLQNAFKFTRPRTTVTLRVHAGPDRVRIEIHDECGGLPGADPEKLFRPFEQRSSDRTGLGLGLAFSRWGVEAHNGRIHVQNLPNHGCVFTVDLPRVAATAAPR